LTFPLVFLALQVAVGVSALAIAPLAFVLGAASFSLVVNAAVHGPSLLFGRRASVGS
jgi:hypothetical protein